MTEQRLNFRGRKLSMWHYILENELTSGTQFLIGEPGGQLYAVVDDEGMTRVLPLPRRGGDKWISYCNSTYGLEEHEEFYPFVYGNLRAWVIKHGTRAELRRFSVYNEMTQVAYMSSYNGRMYKIEPDEITDVGVGTDGVFFVDDDGGVHEDPDIGDHGMLFDRLISGINFVESGLSGITADQQRKAFIVWMFALAFPDLMPTKPILLVEGEAGSGKTTAIVLLQLILMGTHRSKRLKKNQEDDFGVLLLRSPICLFDNADSYIDWVPDAIAAYATLGDFEKRKLYTDDENLVIKPHAFIAATSRNPASFRRADVVDRCIILRLERRPSFTVMNALKAQILADRPQLLGEYLWHVQQIVAELQRNPVDFAATEAYRMADFAAFGRVVGTVLGWRPEDVDAVMRALQRERDAFVNEEEPLIELLRRWLAYRPKHGPQPIGRTISAFQLHTELALIAQAQTIMWKDSPRTLAQKLKSAQIEREFHVERVAVGGQQMFRIWRHTDARLTIVDMDTETETK